MEVTAKYTKARDHQEEVAEFLQVLDKCSEGIFTVLHNRHAAAPAAANPAQPAPARASSTPSTAKLKPEKLSHEASMASFLTWKKQFCAYYDTAHLCALPCKQQQAYLNNCLDDACQGRQRGD